MPRMIPSHLDPDTKSTAEQKLFGRFSSLRNADNWIVMHSVHIAEHPTQKQGEADFTVIIPDQGIFVLEVKGGGISCVDNQWYSKDRYGNRNPIHDPQTEASDAAEAFRQYIRKHPKNTGHLEQILVGFGVIFPDIEAHGKMTLPGLADEQIADCNDLSNLRAFLFRLAEFWKKRVPDSVILPTAEQTDLLAEMLRPDFDYEVPLTTQIQDLNDQVLHLTEHQQDIFLGIRRNERCLIYGGPGTGKTTIALNLARQEASDASEGSENTLVLCSSSNLAHFLAEKSAGIANLTCCTITDFMEDFLKKYGGARLKEEALAQGDPDAYFLTLLPEQFCRIWKEHPGKQYDFLVLDEGQDLMTEAFLEVFNLILKDGLHEGHWYFFMDPEAQLLYPKEEASSIIEQLIQVYCTNFVPFELIYNCRNSRAIIEKLDQIFQTKTQHKEMETRGPEVVFRTYADAEDQADQLSDILSQLSAEKIPFDQIVLLSPKYFADSVCSGLQDYPVTTSMRERKGHLLFSTIEDYRGLESTVVILTDFDRLEEEQDFYALHNGMTRATAILYVLLSEDCGLSE